MNATYTPLRYPGGKQQIFQYLLDFWNRKSIHVTDYYEPFAGGAGLAIKLLLQDEVNYIHLNDFDIHIYAFWDSILNHTEAFLKKMHDTPIDLESWHVQKKIYDSASAHQLELLELGFATFFLNRCNRSGIISGAGPIGGKKQDGKYRMDARFHKKNLEKKIVKISQNKHRIFLYNQDGKYFLKKISSLLTPQSFVYLDPPYYVAGKALYLNSFSDECHREFSEAVKQYLTHVNWMMTYDEHPFISDLYRDFEIEAYKVKYSLQSKITKKEMVISPKMESL
jgi:DNA adenine methylase